jgi:hypothetical protein
MIKAREKKINNTLMNFKYEIDEWARLELCRMQECALKYDFQFDEELGGKEFKARTQQMVEDYSKQLCKPLDIFFHANKMKECNAFDQLQRECINRLFVQYLFDTKQLNERQISGYLQSKDAQSCCMSILPQIILKLMGGTSLTVNNLNTMKNKSSVALEETYWCDDTEVVVRGHRYTAFDLANQFAHLLGLENPSDSIDLTAMYVSENLRNYDAFCDLHVGEEVSEIL